MSWSDPTVQADALAYLALFAGLLLALGASGAICGWLVEHPMVREWAARAKAKP